MIRRHLTYANVVTVLALVAAFAGATAVALPGKGSVQANDLRKNSVKAIAVAKNAVRSAEIQEDAVSGADVAKGGISYADLGTNSVVARIRSTAPATTAGASEANPAVVSLAGAQWEQQADEMQVFFGEYTVTQTGPCGVGSMRIELLVDGTPIDTEPESVDLSASGTETRTSLARRPFLFEPGQKEPRVAALRIWDDCADAGTTFSLDSYAANAVAMR
jgi:hypothetical protein